MIEIDYEPLPAVTTIAEATKAERTDGVGRQPRQHRLRHDDGQQGRGRRGLRQGQARHHADGSPTTASPPTRSSRAPRSATTRPTATATRSTPPRRTRMACRSQLAGQIFHIPETKLRVVVPGRRRRLRHEGRPLSGRRSGDVASRRIGRPVKWTSTRAEALQGDAHGRDQVVSGEIALRRERQDHRHPRAIDARGRLARHRRGVRHQHVLGEAPVRASMTFRPASSSPRRCSPTRRRWRPIAAPAGPRRPIWSSG